MLPGRSAILGANQGRGRAFSCFQAAGGARVRADLNESPPVGVFGAVLRHRIVSVAPL